MSQFSVLLTENVCGLGDCTSSCKKKWSRLQQLASREGEDLSRVG